MRVGLSRTRRKRTELAAKRRSQKKVVGGVSPAAMFNKEWQKWHRFFDFVWSLITSRVRGVSDVGFSGAETDIHTSVRRGISSESPRHEA